MVSFGLVLGMLNAYWMDERKHLIGKLGWLFVAWGLSLFGLTLFRHGNVNPTANPLGGVYIGPAVVGIGLIIYGEGALAIIELPSIVSHIISFTRLLGILLASVVLALVIDNQAVGTSQAPGLVYGGVGLAIAGVVLLVVGHVFNLVLGHTRARDTGGEVDLRRVLLEVPSRRRKAVLSLQGQQDAHPQRDRADGIQAGRRSGAGPSTP